MQPLRSVLVAIIAAFICAPSAWSDIVRPHWVPSWTVSPTPNGKADAVIDNQTVRQVVRVSAGGDMVRISLSNTYGPTPLKIDEVYVARRTSGSQIEIASNKAVTFGGRTSVTIAPGAYVLSDAVPLAVTADSDLAISLFVAAPTPVRTVHGIQRGATYVTAGNAAKAEAFAQTNIKPDFGGANLWLTEVSVSTSTPTRTIIAFGDSITDGHGVDADTGGTWPAILSKRLHKAGLDYSVVNAGISGNRLLHNGQWAGFGDAALARFDRDVLAQPNVSDVIVLISINDLGHANGPGSPEYVSAGDIIDGLTQLALRAHEHGFRIHAATLTPFKATTFKDYYTDEKEARRAVINDWIRGNTVFDSVIDFDKALEDPKKPGYLRPDLDVGDHLHPNTKGAAVMGNAVPLELFAPVTAY
jgi:lysophospholipase L1-like esterase